MHIRYVVFFNISLLPVFQVETFPSAPYPQTPSICILSPGREQVSDPYRIRSKIIVYISMLIFPTQEVNTIRLR